jgi:hypothetical protein
VTIRVFFCRVHSGDQHAGYGRSILSQVSIKEKMLVSQWPGRVCRVCNNCRWCLAGSDRRWPACGNLPLGKINETERGQKTSLLSPEFWRQLEALFLWANLFWRYCLNEEGCRVLMYLQERSTRNGEEEHATLIPRRRP